MLTPVQEDMSVSPVEAQTPDLDVFHVTWDNQPDEVKQQLHQVPISPNPVLPSLITTRLRWDAWVEGLSDHPDEQFAAKLINYIDNGVSLLYNGPKLNHVYPNWRSCDELRPHMEESMLYDISRSWKVGPFKTHPFKKIVGSPMGAFQKPSSSSV